MVRRSTDRVVRDAPATANISGTSRAWIWRVNSSIRVIRRDRTADGGGEKRAGADDGAGGRLQDRHKAGGEAVQEAAQKRSAGHGRREEAAGESLIRAIRQIWRLARRRQVQIRLGRLER